MNSYGAMALDHWVKWRPTQLAEIPDPEAFFNQLGEQVSDEIDQLADALAGRGEPGEGYLGRVGRLGMARFNAEAVVLRGSVLLEPEDAGVPEDVESDSDYLADGGWMMLGNALAAGARTTGEPRCRPRLMVAVMRPRGRAVGMTSTRRAAEVA